jgi:acyl-ACP thioesterase
MQQSFKESHKISHYESDFNNLIRISSIFNYMQEAASNHADSLGFGYEDLKRRKVFWVLSRVKILMHRYLSGGEEIVIETWPREINRLFANRDFKFYLGKNECIGVATTAWLVIDSSSFRPQRPDIFMESLHKFNIAPALPEQLDKIAEPSEKLLRNEIVAGYNDLDVNNHVNNVKYVEYILGCLSDRLLANKRIASMQINFLNETKAGDRLTLYEGIPATPANSVYIDAVNGNNEKIFQSTIVFINSTEK